ncbi:hypothetical protein A2V56_04315 [Candidatus Woesebacteria bacterium RBG_19FT_COMBO_42_9]|nr:MAG: hypothetical protein A2V56_04315 [Candidatus Woesebacteria bacterium RBG_19FT_COMBO_42_9]
MSDTLLFYGAVFLTSVLGLTLGIVALSFRELIKKYYRLKEEYERQAAEFTAKKEALSQEAQKTAEKIVTEAQLKAQVIISEAGTFSTKSKEDFSREVKRATEIQIANFQAALANSQKEAGEAFGGISGSVRAEVQNQIVALRKALEEEINRSRAEARESINEAYQKVEEEVEVYKGIRLKQLDERIFEIISDVISKATGSVLNFDEHEDLVIKALEEAKKQNVL